MTNACAMHDTQLPNLHVDRDGIYDQIGAARLTTGVREPSAPAVLLVEHRAYGLWRTPDRQIHLLPAEDITPVYTLDAAHGQKVRVSNDYWIIDTSSGKPVMRDC